MGRKRTISRRLMVLALTASLGASFVTPEVAGAGAAATVVGTDPEGDWGDVSELAPVGQALGQDLIEASIARPDDDTLRFIMSLTDVPDHNPNITGLYGWFFRVGKQPRSLVNCGGLGVQDCEAPENFLVFGPCKSTPHPVLGNEMPEWECERLGELVSEIDGSANTISVTVPLKMINATPGNVLRMKESWVVAATPGFVMAAYADTEGNSWQYTLNLDVLEIERNYKIAR